MNAIASYLLEVAITLLVCLLIVGYFRPHLKRILVDLCVTEDRAQFWTVFTNILLVGLPVIIALGYEPEANSWEQLFFEIVHKLSGNLGGFLFALVGAGILIAFFALFAPRTPKGENK